MTKGAGDRSVERRGWELFLIQIVDPYKNTLKDQVLPRKCVILTFRMENI